LILLNSRPTSRPHLDLEEGAGGSDGPSWRTERPDRIGHRHVMFWRRCPWP